MRRLGASSRSRASTSTASACSLPLTDGTAHSSSVSARRSVMTDSRHHAVLAENRVQLQTVVRFALGEIPQDERARQTKSAARELLHPGSLHDDGTLRNHAAPNFSAGF